MLRQPARQWVLSLAGATYAKVNMFSGASFRPSSDAMTWTTFHG